MSNPSPENVANQPLAPLSISLVFAALLIAVVTFVFGTVVFTGIGLIVLRILAEMSAVTPPAPIPVLSIFAFSLAAAAVMAVVTARRWCRNARRRAALSAFDQVGDRRVFRFTIRSFLLFQFYVALALGLIRWLGGPVIPGIGGVAGAAAGYWATLFLARRRVFDVVVSCLFGILISIVIAVIVGADTIIASDFQPAWTFLTIVLMPPVVAAVANWRLRKWERPE